MSDLLLRNAKLLGGQYCDVLLRNGLIHSIGEIPSGSSEEVDCRGDLLLPAFVESHIHLDTVLTAGEPAWNKSGTLLEGIQLWGERKKKLEHNDVKERARKVLLWQLGHGVLYVRAHADISDPKLTALQALLELREEMAPYMTLQVMAFPQEGIMSNPANELRLEQALKLGADGIGAIPHGEWTREDGIESLKRCFALADKYGAYVHVFCDETDDPQSRYLEWTAKLAYSTSLRDRVTAAHCSASAYYNEAYHQKLTQLLVSSGIHLVVCPLINTSMQGRADGAPKARGVARVKELLQAGVKVSLAHDDIMTPFYSMGTANMLEATHMLAHIGHMTGAEDMPRLINMVTDAPAALLGLSEVYGMRAGARADMITLPADDAADAVRRHPLPSRVISKGRLIASTPAIKTQLFLNTEAEASTFLGYRR